MIRLINKWLLNKAIQSHKNSNSSKPKNRINEGQKILIIGNYEDRKIIDAYVESLRKLGKRPKRIYYAGKINEPDNNSFVDKEINWAGVPISENIEKRLGIRYDICIFLDFEITSYYRYILELVHSSFLIGPNVDGMDRYADLIIDTNRGKDVQALIESVKFNLSRFSINA